MNYALLSICKRIAAAASTSSNIGAIASPGKNQYVNDKGRPDIKAGQATTKLISGKLHEVSGSALLGSRVDRILGAHLYRVTFSASIKMDYNLKVVELAKVRVQWGFTGERQSKEFFTISSASGRVSGEGFLDAFEARNQKLTPHSIEFYLRAIGPKYLEISDGPVWKPPPAIAFFRAEFMRSPSPSVA